ncbi:hypothetical protein H2200_010934 [Cladophialophora chaetospira]|uniref:Uncharacterized protein n=1 Tax=Cladophialophora chaetospira TaxID=386627 RepID=A0AA39CE24_9EURO|nr:hypothetical protein H2200_010934 [Cladophialophora chaetospira]
MTIQKQTDLENLFLVPNEIFGTTSSPLSATISGGAYEGMATNEIQLMWCLIAMESQGISFQPTDADRRMSILSRRNYVYNLMREQLSDENTARLTPFVLSVSLAAYIENRLGNYEHARYHTRALKKLLDLWGGIKGIRDLQYPFGLMVFNILIEIGLPELYSYQGLLRKLPQLRLKLRELQAWNYNLVSTSSLKKTRGTDKSYLGTILRPSDYLTRRLQAFDKPALKEYISYPEGPLTQGQYRFYLCMLYATNNALWALREKHTAGEIYLDSLVDATEMSESKGFILQCFGEKLPSLLMLLMIGHYAASSEKRDQATEAVFADEEAFEFVELMMLASTESRDVVLKALRSWLTSAAVTELTCLSSGKLDIVIEEIEDKWLERQNAEKLVPSEGRGGITVSMSHISTSPSLQFTDKTTWGTRK